MSEEELEFLDLVPHTSATGRATVKAIFRGKKLRTKFSFSCKMYDQEIKEWIEEESDERRNQAPSATRRRAFSCKL